MSPRCVPSTTSQKAYVVSTERPFSMGILSPHKADGTVEETSIEPSGAVTLAPDVREYFPTSGDVNHALRTLISIVPQKGRTATQHKRNVNAKPLAKTRTKKTG